jgi:hypothetical protein
MTAHTRHLVVWLSVVAGLQTLVASGGLSGLLPMQWSALLTGVVAGLNAGTAAYVAGARSAGGRAESPEALTREDRPA